MESLRFLRVGGLVGGSLSSAGTSNAPSLSFGTGLLMLALGELLWVYVVHLTQWIANPPSSDCLGWV